MTNSFLTLLLNDFKSHLEISSKLLAFSEYMNFITHSINRTKCIHMNSFVELLKYYSAVYDKVEIV